MYTGNIFDTYAFFLVLLFVPKYHHKPFDEYNVILIMKLVITF